jgi:molybdopterin synthase catalytic subunit
MAPRDNLPKKDYPKTAVYRLTLVLALNLYTEITNMYIVTETPINPASAYDLINTKFSGSAVFHYAIVKENTDSDRPTSCINYQQDGDMTTELKLITQELIDKWLLEDLLIVRRTGCLSVGEIISLVAASSPNSSNAFEACQEGINRLKKMATVKKVEVFR